MSEWDRLEIRGVPLSVYRYEALSEAIRQADDFYEADILDELREMYPTQRTIVDVGANIGNHSMYWSAFVPYTALHAFEPIRANYKLLRQNLARYPLAACHASALSDEVGWTYMDIDAVNMGRSHITPAGDIRVPTTTLDSYALDDVTLLKIDTEGHERQVLAGARFTVALSHPAIVVEDNDGRFGEHLAAFGLDGYRCTRTWSGANYLWEWS